MDVHILYGFTTFATGGCQAVNQDMARLRCTCTENLNGCGNKIVELVFMTLTSF